MPVFRAPFSKFPGVLVGGAALLLSGPAARAQDPYFSQPYATRLHLNPAFTGLLDDYSATFSYRDQYPILAGSFKSLQAAADLRPDRRGQHHAFGLLLNQDRVGEVGYTRFEVGGLYAYHTRLKGRLALSGGLRASYGRQRVSYGNFLFGDQISDAGLVTGPSLEAADFAPVNYFSVGTGVVLYTDKAWLSLAGQNLNQPGLGFQRQSVLPWLLSAAAGYKFFIHQPGPGIATQEISLTPVAGYTRQGGSQRTDFGVYFTAAPVTVGAVYRNIGLGSDAVDGTQQVVATIVGVSVGPIRLGYSYDIAASPLSADLGGAHELTLSLRSFDVLSNAQRRLKKRDYPIAPCPAF